MQLSTKLEIEDKIMQMLTYYLLHFNLAASQ